VVRISVLNDERLQAALLALRAFEKTMLGQIRRHTKAIGQPEWQTAVRGRTSTTLEDRVLGATARMQVSNQNVTLKSASIGRALSGGARPVDLGRAVEFGSNMKQSRVTQRSKRGKPYSYTRKTGKQFRPPNRKGYAVYPAAAQMIPRFAALWVQTIVRTFYEAAEGKRSG
jgi:hypothetical protein